MRNFIHSTWIRLVALLDDVNAFLSYTLGHTQAFSLSCSIRYINTRSPILIIPMGLLSSSFPVLAKVGCFYSQKQSGSGMVIIIAYVTLFREPVIRTALDPSVDSYCNLIIMSQECSLVQLCCFQQIPVDIPRMALPFSFFFFWVGYAECAKSGGVGHLCSLIVCSCLPPQQPVNTSNLEQIINQHGVNCCISKGLLNVGQNR